MSALRMASADTIILLIVDYHAAIGCKTPVPPPHPLEYAPVGRTILNGSRQSGSLEGLVNGQNIG